ncbi:MAG: TMEM175 family protein [Gordonia sp. (in: high G+C Gram-positive bacteria)]|uniref:TMEM175 family protein n=1 Tax=Gordonia sp. (in: high G+C Gram-positive bacteria) TaxID=84139 RepID=UPI0039E4FE87
MPHPAPLRTEDGLKRLVAFTDAVVAIAMTLLVLPLADLAAELRGQKSLGEVISTNSAALVGFFISFAVIWILWRNHHQIMENFRGYNATMLNLHFVFLLAIVLLPLATALISNEHVHWADAAYIVVLGIAIGSLIGISRQGVRDPDLVVDDEQVRHSLAGWAGIGTIAALAAALLVTLLFPSLGSWPLLFLALPGPLEAILTRVRGG